MNTKHKQNQENQRQKTRQKQHGPKKQGQNPTMLHDDRKPHDQEHPETRMIR